MADHESKFGFFTTITLVLGVVVVGVVAGMVKIPTFFANREVQQAVETVVHGLEPTKTDEEILTAINQHLGNVKASRFWVEGNRQGTDLNLQLPLEGLTVTRDGNRSMTVDITYTQTMWVPIVNKVDAQTFHVHADSTKPP